MPFSPTRVDDALGPPRYLRGEGVREAIRSKTFAKRLTQNPTPAALSVRGFFF
jgi:hypothetical protein